MFPSYRPTSPARGQDSRPGTRSTIREYPRQEEPTLHPEIAKLDQYITDDWQDQDEDPPFDEATPTDLNNRVVNRLNYLLPYHNYPGRRVLSRILERCFELDRRDME
ncbi:hypothetical protein E4U17_002495 [Claviceps sp. LM77 group G4]|nr:hypothetical protein E4U17_002495 [Claviceps sp. LM77 group G4]KAG6068897.1 hypothetical protein E4U33_004962 [Claviceps sp. LM78 group G4]KAG6072968.1 hypothetical protein E4U16_004987 [Claviceps sp. LM84 group G4]